MRWFGMNLILFSQSEKVPQKGVCPPAERRILQYFPYNSDWYELYDMYMYTFTKPDIYAACLISPETANWLWCATKL